MDYIVKKDFLFYPQPSARPKLRLYLAGSLLFSDAFSSF
jgi:hypothetical protein